MMGAGWMAADDDKRVYPEAPKSEIVDDYHGETVADEYRPLEELDTPATRAWIEAENALTEEYLAGAPRREAIRERLTSLWDYERFTTPFRGRRAVFLRI